MLAGLHVSVCHFKELCFITKHKNVFCLSVKKAYLHAEDVKVKTRSFMSFLSFMQNTHR